MKNAYQLEKLHQRLTTRGLGLALISTHMVVQITISTCEWVRIIFFSKQFGQSNPEWKLRIDCYKENVYLLLRSKPIEILPSLTSEKIHETMLGIWLNDTTHNSTNGKTWKSHCLPQKWRFFTTQMHHVICETISI